MLVTAGRFKMPTPKQATPKENPPKAKGLDKYGLANSGKRAFAATLYGRKVGATTAQVKAATLKKYGKGYPMLNMLSKLDKTSKTWRKATVNQVNNTTGRTVLAYAIVPRKAK